MTSLLTAATNPMVDAAAKVAAVRCSKGIAQVAKNTTTQVGEAFSPVLDILGEAREGVEELNPIEEIQSKLLKERSPEEHAAEVYNSGLLPGKKKCMLNQ